MQKSDFDKLLERYLAGQVSEQERIKIEVWLEVMKTKDTSNLELSKEDEDKLFGKISASADNVDEIIALAGKEAIPARGWVLRIAAAVLIVASVSYTAWYLAHKTPGFLEIASKKGIEKIILNDGSLVWLRAGGRLVYYEKREEGIRYAELNGEALFEVAKDMSHPFVIRCGEASIRVVGTSFSVRTVSDSLELKVLTGTVEFSPATNKAGVDVEPNERLVYKVNGEMEKFSMDKKEVPAIVADTEYNMLFTNGTLEEVMKSISKKFDVAIELTDTRAGKCRITADFTDHSLESTLKMITEVLDVTYTRNGSDIKISGTGCN